MTTNRHPPATPRFHLAAVLVALLLSACGPSAPLSEDTASADGDADGGTAVIALSTDLKGWNPLTAQGQITREIHDQLFLRLFDERADYAKHPPTFAPELAASHEWSADGRTLTLELRRDVVWSDGEPVTSADVAWTLEARTDPSVAWRHASSQEQISAWETPDDHTVVVRYRQVYPDQLANLNQSPILPRHVWGGVPFEQWRQRDDWFRENAVGNGPFLLADWRPSDQLVLVRNPRYHRPGHPRLGRVVFRVVPEKSNQLEMLLAGRIDFVRALLPTTAGRVTDSATARVDSFWHRQYAYIAWNACRPPLDDPLVRRALTLAIDRQAIREAVYGDYARIAVSPILSTLWAFNRDLEPWPYDPVAAAELLESRGWRDRDGDGLRDRDGQPLVLRLATNSDNRMRLDILTMTERYLAALGIRAELDPMEISTWLARNKAHDFDGALGAWLIDTTLELGWFFHSDSIEKSNNWGCYENPEVDRLIDFARSRERALDKLEPLTEIQAILHREQPYTFLFELKRLNGVSRRLRDVRSNSLTTLANLEEWWIASDG